MAGTGTTKPTLLTPGSWPKLAWQGMTLCALLIAAMLLRLIGMDTQSLWLDEGYSLWFARHDLNALWGSVARVEINPPLYYMLLHIWTGLFGESPVALRSLSALINCAALPFVYFTARWSLNGEKAHGIGLLAAILFMLAFSELQYSHEARTYTLCVLGISIVTAASVRILADLDIGRQAPYYWPHILLGGGAALAMWSHFTMVIALGIFGAYHILVWLTLAKCSRASLTGYLVAAGVFFLLGGRALWLLIAYAMHGTEEFWVAAPAILDAVDATSIVFGADFAISRWSLDVLVRIFLFGVWPILGVYAALREGTAHTRRAVVFLLIASVGLYLVHLMLSHLGQPVFLQRIVMPTQIGWLTLCAFSLLAFKDLRLQRLAAGLLILAFAMGTLSYLTNQKSVSMKEPWRDIAVRISDEAALGETVYTHAAGKLLLDYYFQRRGRTDLQLVSLNGDIRLPRQRKAFEAGGSAYTDPVSPELVNAALEQLATGAPSWLVLRNPDDERYSELVEGLSMQGAGPEMREMLYPGPLGLYRLADRRHGGTEIAEETP
ncbi:MAG: glycosyltransferase family 39 protein [Hyphomonadaceae bacterium]|nr:glycosyltransferase family 39 protein [Hyphomonadaceae bacterium]